MPSSLGASTTSPPSPRPAAGALRGRAPAARPAAAAATVDAAAAVAVGAPPWPGPAPVLGVVGGWAEEEAVDLKEARKKPCPELCRLTLLVLLAALRRELLLRTVRRERGKRV